MRNGQGGINIERCGSDRIPNGCCCQTKEGECLYSGGCDLQKFDHSDDPEYDREVQDIINTGMITLNISKEFK